MSESEWAWYHTAQVQPMVEQKLLLGSLWKWVVCRSCPPPWGKECCLMITPTVWLLHAQGEPNYTPAPSAPNIWMNAVLSVIFKCLHRNIFLLLPRQCVAWRISLECTLLWLLFILHNTMFIGQRFVSRATWYMLVSLPHCCTELFSRLMLCFCLEPGSIGFCILVCHLGLILMSKSSKYVKNYNC